MKIKGLDFITGIKKAKGIINENSVIEYLRGFTLNPHEEGYLDIAGTDSKLTLLARIPCENTEDSDGSQISLSSDKIQELVKYIKEDDDIIFKYSEDSNIVEIIINNYRLKTIKREHEPNIDFSVINITEGFDDELDIKEFKNILEGLTSLAKIDSPDLVHQTIYFDGEKAYLFDGSVVGSISFKTNKTYAIDYKSAKQLSLLLSNSQEGKVKLKYLEDNEKVLVKTLTDVLTFIVFEEELFDISFINEYTEEMSFKVNRLDLINSINRTKLATEEDEIYLQLKDNKLNLKGMSDGGEEATDFLDISVVKDSEEIRKGSLEVLSQNLLNLSGIVRNNELIIGIDTENLFLNIRDSKGNINSICSFNFEV